MEQENNIKLFVSKSTVKRGKLRKPQGKYEGQCKSQPTGTNEEQRWPPGGRGELPTSLGVDLRAWSGKDLLPLGVSLPVAAGHSPGASRAEATEGVGFQGRGELGSALSHPSEAAHQVDQSISGSANPRACNPSAYLVYEWQVLGVACKKQAVPGSMCAGLSLNPMEKDF